MDSLKSWLNVRRKKKMSKEQSFEDAMIRLEELVTKLESGELPLKETLTYYKEGVAVAKHCDELLLAAEKELIVLPKIIEE